MENNESIEYIKQAFELKEQKYYKPAIEMLYKALETENDNPEILYQAGELYFLLNDYERALRYLEKVQNIVPEHEQSLKLERTIKQRQGDLNRALEISQKLYKKDNNKENFYNLINILLHLKLFSEIDKYQNSEYFDDEIKTKYANVLYSNGEYNKSREILEQCNPNNEGVLLLEGKTKYDNKDFDGAKKIFNRLSSNTQNPEILNFLGLFELDNMNFTQSIAYFSKASNLDSNNSKYFYNLGNAYFYNGWIEEAKKAYSKALYLAPDNLDYRYSLAYLYYDTKDYIKAKKEVDAILETEPNHNRSRVLKALLSAHDKDYLGAKKILEDNIINGQDDDFTKSSLSKIYTELGIFDKAAALISEILENNPDNLNYMTELAEIYIKEKNYDKSLEIVNNILNLNQNYIAGHILGAKTAYLKQDYELTKKYAQEALSLDINCAKGYYFLALSREATNDDEEAIECMKRAILYDLNNPKYYAKMSEFYQKQNDYKTALEYLSEASSLDDTNEYKYKYSELVKLNHQK